MARAQVGQGEGEERCEGCARRETREGEWGGGEECGHGEGWRGVEGMGVGVVMWLWGCEGEDFLFVFWFGVLAVWLADGMWRWG